MSWKLFSGLALTLLLVSTLFFVFNMLFVKATGTTPIQPNYSMSSEPPLTEWNKTYGGAKGDVAMSLVQTSDGGYALAGHTESFGAGWADFWLVKTDSSGNMLWNKTYGGTKDDGGMSLVRTSDGGYALTGYTESFGAGLADFWLVKTDSSGNMLWNKKYGGADLDVAESLVQTSDGGYALAGHTFSFGVGSSDFWLVKTDSSGNMLWNKTYGGANDDGADSLVQTTDGGYALAGRTFSFGVGSSDFWLVKTGLPLPPIHDVAITKVSPSKTFVGQSYSTSINVTAENQGDYTETFNVTLYADSGLAPNETGLVGYWKFDEVKTYNRALSAPEIWAEYANAPIAIQTQTVTLASGASTIVTFTWNTTGFAEGNYTINAYAWPVPGETDKTDNNSPDGWILIIRVGDLGSGPPPKFFAFDRRVDNSDLALFIKCYRGLAPPEARYLGDLGSGPPPTFFEVDGKIDDNDLTLFIQVYGGQGPPRPLTSQAYVYRNLPALANRLKAVLSAFLLCFLS